MDTKFCERCGERIEPETGQCGCQRESDSRDAVGIRLDDRMSLERAVFAEAEISRLTRELAESRARERTAVDDAATKLVGAERQREGVLETCKAYAYNLDQFRQQNDKCIAIVNAVGNLGAAFGGGSRIGALRGFAKFVRQEFMLPVTASALEELAAAYAALQPFPHVVVGESQWEEGKP